MAPRPLASRPAQEGAANPAAAGAKAGMMAHTIKALVTSRPALVINSLDQGQATVPVLAAR